MALTRFAPSDIAVDLGSGSTRVYVRGKGIVVNEPSVIALATGNNRIVAVGDDAREIAGRSGDRVRLAEPVSGGRITDLTTAQLMVQYFVNKALGTVRMKPRVVAGKPIGGNRMDDTVLARTVESVGPRQVVVVEQIIAAALGAGLPVYEPQGSFVVDIGAGKTEIALVSMGGIVISHQVPIAGRQIDQEIVQHILREKDMVITTRAAEQIKLDMVDVRRQENQGRTIIVRGRDVATGMPTTAEIGMEGVAEAIGSVLDAILEAIKWALSRVPPELCQDVLSAGITLCGGTAALPKLDTLIEEAFSIPVHVARETGDCVILGEGSMADHFELYAASNAKPEAGAE